jgi:hypothetical protein
MSSWRHSDKWFRFFGIPLFALMGNIIFYNRNDSGEERFGFWIIYLLSVAETMMLWEANRLVILYYRKKFPLLKQTKQRLTAILIVCFIVTLIVRTLNIWVYDRTEFWGYQFPLEGYLHSIFVALLFVIIVAGIYEAIYYFVKWKDVAVEAEALKKENLQTQLDSLKTQINPHFLFNSLGSLSSLIEEDPKKAQVFVNDMSAVYRYLLQTNDRGLTTLQKELDFLNAYYQMLKIRFEDGLQLQLNIDERYLDWLIPPLTLQILLENAVKHNAVLPSKPLHVKIYTDSMQNIFVVNNLQKKTSPVISNKTGLNNIAAKYKLLNQQDITIKQTETYFQVIIPLIKNTSYAGNDSGR